MKREDLRKVEYIFSGETCKGYFHQWFNGLSYDIDSDLQISTLYGVIETEEGYIRYADTEDIKFID